VVEVDTAQDSVVRVIEHLDGVHGVLVVPGLNRVYATATDLNQVITLDGSTGVVLGPAPTGDYPDGLAYDPDHGRIWVTNESGGSETVLDVATGAVVATVAHRLGFAACDGDATLYTFDLDTLATRDPITVGAGPDVLAFDPGTGWLYVAAEGGDVAVLAERGRRLELVGSAHLADGAHVVAVDPPTTAATTRSRAEQEADPSC
jgi:DNA-binding beta-propeller fold protein YncE